jgi:hypothetical protein
VQEQLATSICRALFYPCTWRQKEWSSRTLIFIYSSTGMRRITTFWSKMDCIYNGGHIRLWYYNTGWSKSLYAPDDYSTKNMQKYFKHFQSLTMIKQLELGIIDGISMSLVSPWPWQSVAKQSVWAKRTLWTLLVTFCIVINRCTQTFWSSCTIIQYCSSTYHCVTIAYSIQYNHKLYKCVA